MAEPQADYQTRLSPAGYLEWEKALKKAPGAATQMPDDPGPGAMVLCSPAKAAVDYAGRLFADRKIEVKQDYADPILNPPAWGLKLRPSAWRFWARAGFFTGLIRSEEAPEVLKQRMVQLCTRLIGIAKDHEEAHFVGEPFMIRLMALKLSSIGYHGPLLRRIKYGHSYDFEYLYPNKK